MKQNNSETMTNIIPIDIIKWSRDEKVEKFYKDSGYSFSQILKKDVNMPITGSS